MRQEDLLDASCCPRPLDGRRERRDRLIGCQQGRLRNASAEERGRDPEAVRRQLSQRRIGVRERLLDAVHHHVRAQRRDPRLDRGAAVRERDPRDGAVCEREPALGLLGPPRQRTPPGSVDGERGVLRELVVVEPPEPLLHCLEAAVVVERWAEGVDQAGDRVRLACSLPVVDSRLGQVVGDAPRHRAPVELRHEIRLAPLELVAQELAEQVVVAVPLARPVEGHDEAVGAPEPREHLRRPRRLEHGVAQSAAHPIQAPMCR